MCGNAADLKLAGLSLWVLGHQFPALDDFWDGNWLNVLVRVDAPGAFVEARGPIVHASELELFARELEVLNRELNGEAGLHCMEPNLRVTIRGESLGHATATIAISPDHMTQSHEFIFRIDQSYLKPAVSALNDILSRFPLRGTNERVRKRRSMHPTMREKSMSTQSDDVNILTVASCSNVRAEHASHVVVSGSYGGRYNAFNAAKWGVRGVIMNDAGIGKDNAGIVGLEYLDRIGLAAATADAQTCHIGDGDHMMAHGIISHVNRSAAALGCAVGQSVRDCANRMRSGTVPAVVPPPITDGARFVMRDVPGEPVLVCADSIGMLQPDDAGRIVVTASHGALSGGRPDNVVPLDIRAVFFSDAGAGGGMDGAGIARLSDLDAKGIVAGTTAADSAPIGDSRALYRDGILSHVNGPASRAGGRVGMALKDFIDVLIAAAKR